MARRRREDEIVIGKLKLDAEKIYHYGNGQQIPPRKCRMVISLVRGLAYITVEVRDDNKWERDSSVYVEMKQIDFVIESLLKAKKVQAMT